ncbi:MAG: tetratricopeptide repeat protein, partial [Rhodothermales bacterium]|nr:tetratricopeptide repeat protein [Rhodothermales bacterium]
IMLYAPTLGGDDTGPDPDAAFLAAERLDPDSAFFRGDYETAAALYRVMALAGRERPPGRHAELGVVRSLIAMGRFDEAERYIRRLDTDSTRTLTRTDADLLICLRSEIYTRTAEIPLALEYANDCRQRVRPETGVDAAATWYAFYVTAFSHAEADRFDAAIGHYRDALRVLERAGLDRSPEYAQTVNHLANIHYRTGAFTRSRRLHEQALHMRLSLFPESHPAIAASFGNIGNVLHAMGDFESALTHHRRALSIWNGSLGPAHPQTAYSLNNIGFALNRLGRFEEAEYFLLRSEDVKTRVLNGGSLSIARTHRNLADAYLGQGNTHLARRYADRALTAVNESGHQMDILAAQALVSLAGILRAENRTTEAEAALIDAQRLAFEQNHPYAVVAMNQLARAHLADARPRDALAVTQRAIRFGTGSRGQASSGGTVLDAARSPARTSQLVLADSYGIRASAHLDLYRTTAEHERLEAALSSIHRAMGVLGDSPLIRTDLTMSGHLTDRLEDLATTGLEIAVEAWKCGCGGDPIRDALTFSDILKNGFEYTDRLIAEGTSDGPSGHDQHGLDDLRLELFEARRRRAVLDLQFASTPRRVQDLESRIFEIERRIRDARRSIRLERSPGIVEMFDPGPAGLYELPADLLIADYVLLDDRIVAISLTRSGGSIHEIARSPRLDALLKTYPDIVRNAGATLFAR